MGSELQPSVAVLVATHKACETPTESMYQPIRVGARDQEDFGYLRDDEGDNISDLNPYYSELTGLYWAWKNMDIDYLGLVHYRRYFAPKAQAYREGISVDEVVLTQDQVQGLLKDKDILLPKKRKYYIETLYSHYANTLDGTHLDKTREIIASHYPEYLDSFDQVMKQRSGYMFNMYIMDKSKSDAYCEWLFGVLDLLREQVDTSRLTPFEARLFGRVSELLLNVWVLKQNLRVQEVPFVYMDKVDFVAKIKGFLAAKFLGKKYDKSF